MDKWLHILLSGSAVEVWGCTSNFIPHVTGHVITCLCLDWNQIMLIKGDTGVIHFSWVWVNFPDDAYMRRTFKTNFVKNCMTSPHRLITLTIPHDEKMSVSIRGNGILRHLTSSSSVTTAAAGTVLTTKLHRNFEALYGYLRFEWKAMESTSHWFQWNLGVKGQ